MSSNMRYQFISWVSLCLLGGISLGQPKNYDQHILPILRDKCAGCHNAEKSRGGLDVSTYGKLMEGGSSGAVVKPGDSEGSRLYLLAAHKEEPKMPPNAAAMAKESLDLIKAWIEAGAPENAGSKVDMPEKKTDAGLTKAFHGRPPIPPMPNVTLPLDPVVRAPRANAVTALAASPWAPLLAVASAKQVLLFHGDTLELIGILPFSHGQINVLRFSRSGEVLLAAGGRGGKSGKAVLFDVKTGKTVTEIGDETDAILSADLSPDQSMVAVGGSNRLVRIYATADGSKVREMKKHTEWVTALEFSPDGVLLATGDRNGGLVVWEANTGREYFVLPGHRSAVNGVSWRDDANHLASASDDGTIKVWEMEDGKQVRSINAHGSGVQSCQYAHDGRLVSCGRDGRAKMFDANGAPKVDVTGFADLPTKAAVTHDGLRLLAGDWTGTVRAWMLADGKPAGQVNNNPPRLMERLEATAAELVAKDKAATDAQVVWIKAAAHEKTLLAERQTAETNAAAAGVAVKNTQALAQAANDKVNALSKLQHSQQQEIVALQIKLNALQGALRQVQVDADKIKDNPAIGKGVQDVKKLVDDCGKQLNQVQTSAAKTASDLAKARDAVAKTTSEVQAANQAEKAAKDALGPKVKAHQEAAAATAAAKAAFEKLHGERDAAQAALNRIQNLVAGDALRKPQ
jgi:hypothetical protein